MAVYRPKFGIAASARRRQDSAFISGQGQYIEDIAVADMLHGVVLCSCAASATFKIRSIRAFPSLMEHQAFKDNALKQRVRAAIRLHQNKRRSNAALEMLGIRLILTAYDLSHHIPFRTSYRSKDAHNDHIETFDIPTPCNTKGAYAEDAIAFIGAVSVHQTEHAAKHIDVSYQSNATVIDRKAALQAGANLVWPELTSNKVHTYHLDKTAEVAASFSKPAKITTIEFFNDRLVSRYMKTRCAFGRWNDAEQRYKLPLGSQGVHGICDVEMPATRLRVWEVIQHAKVRAK